MYAGKNVWERPSWGFIYMPKHSRNRNNIFRTAAARSIGSNSLFSAYFFDPNDRSVTTYVTAYLVVLTLRIYVENNNQ